MSEVNPDCDGCCAWGGNPDRLFCDGHCLSEGDEDKKAFQMSEPRRLTADERRWLGRDVESMWVSRQQAERIYAATAARLAWLEAHAERQARRLAEAERLLLKGESC
jgi:hypothetical protein